MKNYLQILQKTMLMQGLSEDEILSVLKCLNACVKSFDKNQTMFFEGDTAQFAAVVLEGELQTQKTDYNGNVSIVTRLFAADTVAASACFSKQKRMPFDVISVTESKVLCVDGARLIRQCCTACAFHTRLIENLLVLIADNNLRLSEKIDILTKRTIKEKVLTYLYGCSQKPKNKKFTVPMSRREMAEFLSVDRSALSRELCSLRDEGVLSFDGNVFCLKQWTD